MSFKILSPAEDLPVWLSQRLFRTENDFSRNLILFPGKRPAHFLRRALAVTGGTSLIPPVIWSMDQFIDLSYEKTLGFSSPDLKPLDALACLFEIHQGVLNQDGQKQMTLEEFFPIGVEYYRALEELYVEKITPQKVREIDLLAEEKLPPQAVARMAELSRYYREFYRLIEREGYSTRSVRYRKVSEGLEARHLALYDQIFVAGFFGLTNAEQSLFAKMAAWPNTQFVFQEGPGIREKASAFGFDVAREPVKTGPPGNFSMTRSPDVHGELFGASSVLFDKKSGESLPDQKTVLVLPSSGTLIPALSHLLSRMKPDQYNISLGYPLRRTPLFEFFSRLIGLLSSREGESVDLSDYLDFMLHPYMKSIQVKEGPEKTFSLIHSLEEYLSGKNARRFMTLFEIESNPDFVRIVTANGGSAADLGLLHRNTIETLMSLESLGDFCLKAMEVLIFISQESSVNIHPLFGPSLEAFLTHLEEMASSRLNQFHSEDPTEYFQVLNHSIQPLRVPFEGTPLKGLQTLGFLETRNLRFDRVIILDVNEEVLPEAFGIEIILPPKVRKILGLPSHEERENLSAYYFDTLIRGAKEVHFFYVENNRMEKSRFLERILWEQQKRDHIEEASSLIQSISYTVNLRSARPQEVEKSENTLHFLKGFRFSAASLQTYLFCPLKFYFHYPLHLSPKKEAPTEHEREEIGTLVHEILHDYFREKQGRPLTPADLSAEEMEQQVYRKFESEYGKELSGHTFLMRGQVTGHLIDYLAHVELPKVKAGRVEIIGLEQKVMIERRGFTLSGKIDRTESRNGQIVVLDYKTGSNPQNYAIRFDRLVPEERESYRRAIKSLQLPFYHYLYSEAEGVSPAEMESSYLFLGKKKLDKSAEVSLFPDGSKKLASFEALTQVIFNLLNEICDPSVPFFAETDEGRACQTCEYQPICHSRQD